MQGRQVCSLQYRHSKILQWGPEWQRLQVHWIKVLSDLIILNEWAQGPATAILDRKQLKGLGSSGSLEALCVVRATS